MAARAMRDPEELVQRVYRQFRPSPLTPDQQDLYVNLDAARGDADVVRRMERKIRLAETETCQVLAGHRGSGKSTELVRLRSALELGAKKFFVVLCKADEDTARDDVDFPDLLVAILRQLAQQVRTREGIELRSGYFRERWQRLKEFLSASVNLDSISLDVGLLTIAGTIKGSPDARRRVREILEPDAGAWIHAANDVIAKAVTALAKKRYAGLVVLVDDLDKMVIRPHDKAGCLSSEYLFVHRAAQLTGFACHVVYTMPISLAYSHHEQTIKQSFGGHVPVVPMTKIATRPPRNLPYEAGIALFRELIERRLERAEATVEQVFATGDVRDELIRLSGGQPTELMTLLSEAIVTDGLPVTERAVARVRNEGQREYVRQLRKDHEQILREVAATGAFVRTEKNESAFRELLDSRAVLQYVNDDEWYGLNPLLADRFAAKSSPKPKPSPGKRRS